MLCFIILINVFDSKRNMEFFFSNSGSTSGGKTGRRQGRGDRRFGTLLLLILFFLYYCFHFPFFVSLHDICMSAWYILL